MLGYADFMNAVSEFLGYGATYTTLSVAKKAQVDRCVQSGVRRFYNPPSPPAPLKGYEWSFLRPCHVMTVEEADVTLPSVVGAVLTPITFTELLRWQAIKLVGEGEIRKRRQHWPSTGVPTMLAIRPVYVEGGTIHRWQMMFWPEPDQAYEIEFRYSVIPPVISVTLPYPLGGQLHQETILASCLAAAELFKGEEKGVHHSDFMEQLTASIRRDEWTNKPDSLGYMRGDVEQESRAMDRHSAIGSVTISYNGVAIDAGDSMTILDSDMLSLAFGGGEGVLRNDGNEFLACVADDPANMTVSVAPGYAWIIEEGATPAKSYHLEETEVLEFTAPTENDRIDLIEATLNTGIVVVEGVEASSPEAPATSDDSIALAEVYIRVGATSIKDTDDSTNGYITDKRVFV